MDTARFHSLIRTFAMMFSRRSLTGALGFGALSIPMLTDAKKKRKKKKKVKRNEFGCVNVGSFCTTSDQCCSGICQGKKGKKTCLAHNASTCDGTDGCSGEFVPCTTDTGADGTCNVTTGSASYCATAGVCFDCTKDTDCEPVCGVGAACLGCAECVLQGLQTACAGANDIGCTFI